MSPLHYILASLLALCISSQASPVHHHQQQQQQQNHPRAVQEYVYMALTPIAPTPTGYSNITCPTNYVSAHSACPSGCIAAPCAGLIGIATSKFTCETSTPATSWSSYRATSTCEAGSAVTTYTLWGGQEELGCKETGGA